MSKILLAQPVLKPDWIDLSVGEPHLIREILLEEVDVNKCFPKLESEDFTYPSPCGYDKLVEYLETKHGAPVVITNGAKQGLGAAIYAAKQMGACRIWTPSPYWALLPPLFDLHGLKMTNTTLPNRDDDNDVACLVVSPNNPDGKVSNMILNQNVCNYRGSLLIHDAAYYTPIYIEGLIQKVYGDAQIYSISKMFGLSSLRLGYVVCKNEDMYKHIQYYMEHMTVSVSKLPQMFLLNIINSIDMDKFERRCFESLQENRRIVRKIDSSVIEMLDDKSNEAGMFLWARLKNKKIFDKAKLNIIDGSPFGKEGFVRINIAFKTEMMQEIVDKINKACEKG